MPLIGKSNPVTISGSIETNYPEIKTDTTLEDMGLGMELRTRARNYPEIVDIPRSIYYQSNFVNTTERSVGMPQNSGQAIFTRLTGTSGTGLQVSSSSASDTGAGIVAQTIYIEGLYYSGGDWLKRSTFSTPTTLTGQTAVQIGTDTDWYRINKIWVLSSGTSGFNIGDLYISPLGTTTTAGVPDSDILNAVIATYSNSTGGCYSIASNERFNYTFGNFWISDKKDIVLHETFFQDFNGSGNTADMTQYEVGNYPSSSVSYDYTGSAPYTEKTDICLTCFTTTGTDNLGFTYYVEFCISNANLVNL